MTNRVELERRVDELAERAVRPGLRQGDPDYFGGGSTPSHRRSCGRILLERASNLDQAVMDRVDARGWLRRQWDRAGGSSPFFFFFFFFF